MSAKSFIIFLVGFLAAWSWLAVAMKPEAIDERLSITWTTGNNPVFAGHIETFNAQNPDLRLRLDYSNWDIRRLLVQCSSGVGPEIFDISSTSLEPMVEAGIALDVTDIADQEGFSLSTIWPSVRNEVVVNGRMYAYPAAGGSAGRLF